MTVDHLDDPTGQPRPKVSLRRWQVGGLEGESFSPGQEEMVGIGRPWTCGAVGSVPGGPVGKAGVTADALAVEPKHVLDRQANAPLNQSNGLTVLPEAHAGSLFYSNQIGPGRSLTQANIHKPYPI
jgi:hypothetical protein